MDIEKFTRMISSEPRDALVRILKNVRDKNACQHEEMVIQELDKRFPGWERSKKGVTRGRTHNRAIFKGKEKEFTNAKDGFIWLVTQMVSDGRGSLINRREKMELAFSKKRKYLASSPKELFIDSEHLAEDRNNYAELPYGWYLNVNLPNKQKFDVLARVSWVLEIRFPNEWDWVVDGNTEEVSARRSIQETVQGLGDLLRD